MTIFNNEKYPSVERYLKGLHDLKEIDVAIFIRLLQESKIQFTATDVLTYCKEWCIHNYEREAYNIIARLQKNDLVWKIRKNLRQNIYERMSVEGLKAEFDEGIEDLKEELVNIKERSIYQTVDPRENTLALDTERQIINAIIKLKKQGFSILVYLRFSNSMITTEAQKYRRFMRKLNLYNITFDVQKDMDVVLAAKKESFIIIFLSMYDDVNTKKTHFYGCQLEDNGKIYKYIKK